MSFGKVLVTLITLAFGCSNHPKTPRSAEEESGRAPTRSVAAKESKRPKRAEKAAPEKETSEASTAPSPPKLLEGTPSDEKVPNAPNALESKEIRFEDVYPESRSVSLFAFEKENGLRGPKYDQRCWPIEKVGVPASRGLLCLTRNARPEFTLAGLYVVEEKSLRLVWQETVATYANWLELTPLLSEDGATLTLTDRRPYSCERALAEYRAKVSARVAPPSGELLEPACRRRGEYVFERGRFRLVEAPKKGPGFPPSF